MNRMLGLPDHVRACLFDLDGVLTDTASVHRQAWKAMFDDYLRARSDDTGEEFVPFDAGAEASSAREHRSVSKATAAKAHPALGMPPGAATA